MNARNQTSATTLLIVERVRLRARRLALWMQVLWRQGETSPDQGLAITAGEVDRLLRHPDETARAEHDFHAADPALSAAIAQADQALTEDAAWSHLAEAFDLAPQAADLLSLALATAVDPDLKRVWAYLNDDLRQTEASPLLSARLFEHPVAASLSVESLLRWRLAMPVDSQSPWRSGTGWQADPAVALSLEAGAWRDPSLGDAVSVEPPEQGETMPLLHADALARMIDLQQGASGPLEIDLLGSDGAGKRILAAQFARAIGRTLLTIDTDRVPGGLNAEAIIAAFRFARYAGAATYWRGAASIPAADWTRARNLGSITLRSGPPSGIAGSSAHTVTIGALPTAQRLAAWAWHSDHLAPLAVKTQRLSPAEIALAAKAAPEGPDAIRAALRRTAPPQSELLAPLACPYDWDDLVIAPTLERQLREFESQVRLRWPVYEDWGFERLTHLGRGISALFGGPSGTGKTMAAQVLARSLELDLYRVDLAGVVNKYIGETEKRLRDVFDYCERAGALLFFDEADALFGKRMQVKDSHDRFANIEINYLLQRIEQFDGVAILATNRRGDLDPAFVRRLRFIIDFMPPGPQEREALWRRALPRTSPSGEVITEDLDWPLLAERLAMTGADIKASALGAAFLARAENQPIAMRHVLASAQREMTKHGQVVRAKPIEGTER